MKCSLLWTAPPVADGATCTCAAYASDGRRLAVGSDHTLLTFHASSGRLHHRLEAHEAAICSVSWSHHGQQLSTGAVDGIVIVWSADTGDVLVSYAHDGPVATVAFNPTAPRLASVSDGELALWSPDSHTVFKDAVVDAIVLCLGWSSDGSTMALGQADGCIALRNADGVPLSLLDATPGIPVTALAWAPTSEGKPAQRIAACGGDGTLALLRTSGTSCKQSRLGFALRSICFFGTGDLILICGSSGHAQLYSRDGMPLGMVASSPGGLASVAASSDGVTFAAACEDGSVAVHTLQFAPLQCSFGNRCAHRESPTDVVVQHLGTCERVRIRCRTHVLRLALHRRRLAVALPDQVAVYELPAGAGDSDMGYRLVATVPCDTVSAMTLHNIDGVELRQWQLTQPAYCLALLNELDQQSVLLVAQHGGQVLRVDTANSAPPTTLLRHAEDIEALESNTDGSQLAVLDIAGNLTVYHLSSTQTAVPDFEAHEVSSMAWNNDLPEVFCWTGGNDVWIRTADFPAHRSCLQDAGPVVRFKGCQVSLLLGGIACSQEVPLSAGMQAHLAAGNLQQALEIAELGVTENDWRALGTAAAAALQLPVARAAFSHLGDEAALALLQRVEQQWAAGGSHDLCTAEVLAYQGKLHEAASMYARAGAHDKAVTMFQDQRMFSEAEAFTKQHAAAVQQQEDARLLAELSSHMQAGDHEKFVALMEAQAWWERLADFANNLDPRQGGGGLRAAAAAFSKAGRPKDVEACLRRLGDTQALVELLTRAERWEEARAAAEGRADLLAALSLSHAQWLERRGCIDDARQAYRDAQRPEDAEAMLRARIAAALKRRRFALVASLHQDMALDALAQAAATAGRPHPQQGSQSAQQFWMARFAAHYRAAEDFTAFALVVHAAEDCDADMFPHTLFGAARFLLLRLLQAEHEDKPPQDGISWPMVVRTVAQTAQQLGACRLARFAWTKLRTMPFPPEWRTQVDMATLMAKGLPMTDAEELLPVCFRCGATNNLAGYQGDACASCSTAFLRSFVTFDHLPAVLFELEPGITHEEAQRLLSEAPAAQAGVHGPFGHALHDQHGPIVVDRALLRSMLREEVLIRRWPHDDIPPEYFHLVDGSLPLTFEACGHAYEQDELKLWEERLGYKPFCCPPEDEALRCHGDQGGDRAAAAAAVKPEASAMPPTIRRALKYSHTMERSSINFQARDVIEIQ